MTIINFDDIIAKKFKTITNNIFCLNHPTNCLIIGKTNSGKTNELNILYQDINLNITLKEFQNINNNLQRYEFIMIDKYNENEFIRIRKNFDQIYISK